MAAFCALLFLSDAAREEETAAAADTPPPPPPPPTEGEAEPAAKPEVELPKPPMEFTFSRVLSNED